MGGGRRGSGKTCVQSGDTDTVRVTGVVRPPGEEEEEEEVRLAFASSVKSNEEKKDEAPTQVFFNKIVTRRAHPADSERTAHN